MFGRILVPLDGSEYGERALPYATDFARLAATQVFLLSVVPTATAPMLEPSSESDEDRARPWKKYLDGHAEALRAAGIEDVVAEVRFGPPARVIIEAARDEEVDLIIMSTHGLGASGRYALGSIALKVLMTAPCPVFMVRIAEMTRPQQ